MKSTTAFFALLVLACAAFAADEKPAPPQNFAAYEN